MQVEQPPLQKHAGQKGPAELVPAGLPPADLLSANMHWTQTQQAISSSFTAR